jgi:hypothetical protein
MSKLLRAACVALAGLLAVPAAARAQGTASIAGVVRDSSGAVLPGATVEASSPVLIEKTRTVVTDGSGQYKIEELRPGAYTVTFTLTGFNTVKREGIELTGSFAATVNAELRVGAVEETVTVTGESPLVDVQSSTKERVLANEVLRDIPTGRTQFAAATLIAGMNLNNQDVGGTNIINTTGGSMTIHGSNGNDQRVMIDGMSTANSELAGQASNFLPNFGAVQEMAVDYSSGTADQATGGVRINMIPREGGNVFKGSIFGTGVNASFQGSNYSQALQDRGLKTPNSIQMEYDVNPGFGGPLKENTLWFYGSGRWVKTANYVGGMFANLNAGNPNVYTYAPDLANRGVTSAFQRSVNLRLTWQANAKNKFSVFADDQGRCQCAIVSAVIAPEAANSIVYPIQRMVTGAWTSPVTNRLLIEARGGFRNENYAYSPTQAGSPLLQLIPVTDLGGTIPGLLYHGGGLGTNTQPYQNTNGRNYELMGAVSYVTGSHAFKTGITDTITLRDETLGDDDYHVSYVFNSPNNPYVPTPVQIQERTTPYRKFQRQPAAIGLYAQDKWTLSRLTLNLGLRLDYLSIYIPAQHLGPAPLVPTRNIDLPETPLVNWKDLTPRLAATYDLLGTGKTALRVSLSKYVVAQGVQGTYGDQLAPVNRLANVVTRNWTDSNHNFIPDCDLTNPNAQSPATTGSIDTCGAMSDRNFGSATPSTTINPATLNGWGVRPYDWELSTGVQHQILPRMSIDVGYFRRWFGNFSVVDNRALAPGVSDFGAFSVTAPLDSRLPNGGGYAFTNLYDINASKVGQVDNYFTFASDYGNQIQHWNGVDVTLNARPGGGVLLQGGLSTGRQITDNCAILARVPEWTGTATAPTSTGLPFCRQVQNFQTQVKFLGAYTLPKVDVQVSGAFQSIPGPQIAANEVLSSAAIQSSLGRPLAGVPTVTVNLVQPGALFGDRLNQLDLRFSKALKYRGTRTSLNLDLYNVFNVDTVLAENSTYTNATATGWRVPTTIVTARFAKISVQFDY